jgi:hypothetical protein
MNGTAKGKTGLLGAAYIPPPERLIGIPSAERVRPKTRVAGRRRARWLDTDGNIYEWDYQHGHVEAYNRRGQHIGAVDPETGRKIGDAAAGTTSGAVG